MTSNLAIALVFATACMAATAAIPGTAEARRTVFVKHPPIVNVGDASDSWSAKKNLNESKQYERLLRTNPAFRQARMRKECGPITDPELRKSCMASFDQG
jgi:hypothetical protein